MDPQPGIRERLLQLGNRALVFVRQVRTVREQLDGVEAVRRDLDQVIAAQPFVVIQVGGDGEGWSAHGATARPTGILPLY